VLLPFGNLQAFLHQRIGTVLTLDLSNALVELLGFAPVTLEDIEEAGLLSPDQRKRKSLLQQEILEILDNKELFWRQRSRENWLLQGDGNSAFFHRASNGCRRKRTIFSLKNGDSIVKVMLLY
jgi:hypothetical protein